MPEPRIGREAAVEAPERRNEAERGEAEARGADLELERAVRPADEPRRHLSEEDVEDRVVEIEHADRPEHEPRQQLLDHQRRAAGLRRAHDATAENARPMTKKVSVKLPSTKAMSEPIM